MRRYLVIYLLAMIPATIVAGLINASPALGFVIGMGAVLIVDMVTQ